VSESWRERALISVSELEGIGSTHVVIFDCRHRLDEPDRGRKDFLAGHIPGARHLDLDSDLSAPLVPGPRGPIGGRHPLPDPEVFAELLRSHGVRPDTLVVSYDDTGGPFAARLWWTLRWLGHSRARVLDGGLQAWSGQEFELEAGAETSALRGTWAAYERPELIADARAVRASLVAGTSLLVDCRDRVRFEGTFEPIDPVGGHIPGAINRPWRELVDGDSGLARPPELPLDQPAILYCGSGVTACVGLLALVEFHGREDVRLYPGSWSGWLAEGGEVSRE
jgi:thiosulfate/3-mercaptopyruvate sulfurtransferase